MVIYRGLLSPSAGEQPCYPQKAYWVMAAHPKPAPGCDPRARSPLEKGGWCHQGPPASPTTALLLSPLSVATLQQGHGLGGAQPRACLCKPTTRHLSLGRWPTGGAAPTPQGHTLPWEHPQCGSIPSWDLFIPGTSPSQQHPHPGTILILGPSASQEHPHCRTIPILGPSPSQQHPHTGTIPIPGHPHPRACPSWGHAASSKVTPVAEQGQGVGMVVPHHGVHPTGNPAGCSPHR